jgi:transcription initiation factor TFIIE subunit beta
LQRRQALTAEQINEATYVDIRGNKAVFESLKKNPKVNFVGECFFYKVSALLNII